MRTDAPHRRTSGGDRRADRRGLPELRRRAAGREVAAAAGAARRRKGGLHAFEQQRVRVPLYKGDPVPGRRTRAGGLLRQVLPLLRDARAQTLARDLRADDRRQRRVSGDDALRR